MAIFYQGVVFYLMISSHIKLIKHTIFIQNSTCSKMFSVFV